MSVQPVLRESSVKKVLLVGGFPQDERRIGDDLRPYGVLIGWRWQGRAEARRRDFPACDAVIVASKACPHALQDSAKVAADKAGVPLVVFSSKSRSLEHLKNAGVIDTIQEEIVTKTRPVPPKLPDPPNRPSFASVQAALLLPVPPSAKPEPTTPPPAPPQPLSKEDRLDEIIIEIHDKWSKLPEDTRKVITKFLVAYDADRSTPIPSEMVKVLQGLKGQPKSFLAFVLHATQGCNILQNSAVKLHLQFFKKGVCASSDIPTRARDLCGPDTGFRPVDRSTLNKPKAPIPAPEPVKAAIPTPPPAPEPVHQTQPPKEMPVSNPKPITPPSPQTSTEAAMTARFNVILMAAVESGEKVTVQKAKNGTAYAITYSDGVTLTLSL